MSGTASLFVSRASIYLLFIVVLASCSSGSQGDCFYQTVDTFAKIVSVEPHADGDGRIAVMMSFEASSLALEDQDLGKLKDLNIDHDFLVRNNIEIGNRYEVTVSEITSGDCIPLFTSFQHSFE